MVSVYYEDAQEPLEVREVKTDALDPSKMPTLGMANSYREGDAIVLNYRNVTSEVLSEKWTVNGREIEGTVVKLSSGSSQRIRAELTTAQGVEYLVKYVDVR